MVAEIGHSTLYHVSHGTSVQWPISDLVHCTAADFSLSTPYSRPNKSPGNLGLLIGQGYRVPRLKLATVYLYSVLRLISVVITDQSYDCLVVVEPHLDLGGMMKSNFFFLTCSCICFQLNMKCKVYNTMRCSRMLVVPITHYGSSIGKSYLSLVPYYVILSHIREYW